MDFKIRGMDCAEEIAVLQREVGPVAGGAENLTFDLLRGKMSVKSAALPENIIQAVNRTGMKAERWTEGTSGGSRERKGTSFWVEHGRNVAMAASGAFTLTGFLHHALIGSFSSALGSEGLGMVHAVPLAVRFYYAAAIVSGGWYIAPKAWLAARRLRPDMNLLMTIAVLGALVIGEWLEAAIVTVLFALSLALESWSIGRARRAVEKLLALSPPTARITAHGVETEVPAEDVPVGSIFRVRPGDRVPLDGEVVYGTSEVNQAPITGESVPVLKEAGASVFAGTINGNGALEVRSTKTASDTTLAHIIQMVGAAQAERAPSERWVERFARYYTPIVFMAAILTFLAPPLFLGAAWDTWAYRALVLLVIGCPCALVISTPVSIVAAITAAARSGVLVKGGTYVEVPAGLMAVAMDKTGTLTEGRPRVVEVLPEEGVSDHTLLKIAASIESQSNHPLARAIMEYCYVKGIAAEHVTDYVEIQGKGATCTIAQRNYWLGSHRYLEERREETPAVHDRLRSLAARGNSVVVIGDETRVIGMIALADAVRPKSRHAVESLRRLGVQHVVMLTGDNQPTAKAIAAACGIDEFDAELLPEDKVASIRRLVERYGQVAMVGDGINDAPAMARATLGIAMGAAGSDAAIETADVALMSDDIAKIPWLVQHSRRTRSIVRQNIILSLGIKALFVFLTFAGYASLWAAIAADMGVSLVVIFNALRLLRPKPVG
jgi:Cd2+/Zn2+-exporting ATPase